MKKLLLLFFLIGVIAKAQITTPYPNTIVLKQINGAEKERLRLCQGHKKYDRQPTGFYVEAGKKLKVNVEIQTPADNNTMPILIVGTMGFNVDNRNTGTQYTLTSGTNEITPTASGLIWLSFTTNAAAEPKGVARITFADDSEQVRAPMYVYGVTTDSEMNTMLDTYKTPDVLFYSDYAVVVATREAARTYYGVKREEWLNAIHTLLALEDKVSGLNNNDENPLHHRLKSGEIRHLLVQNSSASPHANSAGYTGYPSGSISRYLTTLGTSSNNSWMLGHELGHQHQQPAWTINQAGESTVNIYSYVVERHFAGQSYNRTSAERWQTAQDTYLKYPLTKRIYDMNDDTLQALVGFNRDELRFMPWEQLLLLFGDQFYINLHRVTREEKVTGGEPEEKRAYLIWKASQVSGYDLTEFFNQWGIRVSDESLKAVLRARIANALAKGTIVPLPYDVEICLQVTGQNRPDWAPLPLKGITTSAPENTSVFLDRSHWKIAASYQGISDNTVGGTAPEFMIDGNSATSFVFVKPGKTYGGLTVEENDIPSFTVDMKTPHSFNCVSYTHRTGNATEWLRARQLSVYGSNDSISFTPLLEHYAVDYTKNANELLLSFNEATYRYVQVVIEDWNKESGSTIQVQEFNVGTYIPAEILPDPQPLKFNVNVKVSADIVSSQEGKNSVNEDSDFTIGFSMVQSDLEPVVVVEGDTISPAKNNDGTYSFTVKAVNHLQVAISAKSSSGIKEQMDDRTQIRIYPNPIKVGQAFYLKSEQPLVKAEISVFDMVGQKITGDTFSGDSWEYELNTPGVYLLQLIHDQALYTTKLIVE